MDIEQILEEWRKDAKIDDLNVDLESSKVPNLHSKYITMLSEERSRLRLLQVQRRDLLRMLREYYLGTLSQEELNKLGRTPYLGKVLKNEVMVFVDSDSSLIKFDLKIAKSQEKVEVLLEIMKSISNRNFSLKTITDWKRMMVGG